MEKILLGKELSIYRLSYTPNNCKEDLLIDVNQHIENNKTMEACDAFDYHDEFPRLNEIIQKGVDCCLKIAQENNINYTKYNYNSWINRVRGQFPIQYFFNDKPYHNHVVLNEGSSRFVPTYTFIYYIQMPNNLNVGDAELVLRDGEGIEYPILPKENEFLIHDSNIDHYPKDAKNSTIDRIVLATNVGFE
jgi:hypothetical protein